MKKLIFIISAAMFLISCTRASNSDNAKIQIKLPDLTTSYSGKVGTLSEPTSLSDLNCYMVFVGGPEQDLRRNTCPTSGNSATGTPSRNINFGPLYGGFAPSTEISIEVPSGNDRVLHLVGMRVSAPEICRDFKAFGFPGHNESSKPFIIGSADRVLLEPSKTIEIPIKMSFNTADGIEKCTGPDVPQDSGGGGNSNEPYLRFEGLGKWSYPANKDLGTVGQCYQVRPALYINGSSWVDPGMSNIDINVSTFNAGQFYSDSACSAAIGSLQIPSGQSKSTNNYYFKATAPLANVTVSGWTLSGNSTALQNSNQTVDFGYPKLSFYGPDKLPQGLCAKYHVVSEYYEGGPLNVTGGGLTINLTDNVNFYLRATPGCSTGTSTTITTATNSTDVYLKIMSPATNVNFNLQATAPNYNSSNYVVQTSLHYDHADSIQVLTKDSSIVRGVCNQITVRLVNSDGGAATAKNNMNLFFKVPQGAGSFYTLPDCSGAPVSSIPLISGFTELNIGFKANSLPLASLIAGKLPMQFHFGSIRIQNSLFNGPSEISFNVADQNDPWFLQAMPPSFNGAEIVGTHEFDDGGSPDTFKFIPLLGNYTNLTSVECSATPGTGYSACSGSELDTSSIPYKYKWSSFNASTPNSRYVRFNYTSGGGSGNREIKISPDALYGNNFKVVQCGTIIPANTPIESISGTGVLCLPANSIHSRSSPTAFILSSTRTSLIGHSTLTSELNGGGQSALIFYSTATNIPNNSFYLANIKFRNLLSAMPAIGFSNPIAASVITGELNNIDITDGGAISSTNIVSIANSDPDLSLKLRNIKINSSGTNNTSIYIYDSNNVYLENVIIDSNNSMNGVKVSSSSAGMGSSIKVLNSTIKTSGGVALELSYGATSNGSGIEIINSVFQMSGAGNIANPVIKVNNRMINLSFENNIIQTDPGTQNLDLLHLFSNTASQFTGSIRTNTFLQGYYGSSAITIEGGYNIDINDFSDNSIATTALANNNANGMFNIFSATTLNISTSVSTPQYGGNLACSNNGSYIFTVPYINNGAIGGTLGAAGLSSIPTIMNNMSLTSKRCIGL